MKLAEALIERAALQKRIAELTGRASNSVTVQDGDKPLEEPNELIKELIRAILDLHVYVERINRTNSRVTFEGDRTIADIIAQRDCIRLQHKTLLSLIGAARSGPGFRYGRNEIKTVVTVDIAYLQSEADALAKEQRELDVRIQQTNWNVDLL